MLKLLKKIALIVRYAVRIMMIIAAVGLFFVTAAAYVVVTYKRETVEAKLGSKIGNFLYGVCDPAYEALVNRRRTPIDEFAKVSKRFRVNRPASAITEDEEAEVIGFIERAFGWKVPFDTTFSVSFNDDDTASFQPYQGGLNQITIDECGYLLGDNYATRQRHAEHLRKD